MDCKLLILGPFGSLAEVICFKNWRGRTATPTASWTGGYPDNRRMDEIPWENPWENPKIDDFLQVPPWFRNLHMNRTRKDQSQILHHDGPSSDGVRHMPGIQKLQCFYWPDGPLDTPKNGEVGTDHRSFRQDFFNWGHYWPWGSNMI